MAMRKGLSPVTLTALAGGLAFLYVPLILLVIYSFNESRLVTVWGGWSTRWYRGLLQNQALMDAAWVSLKVAAVAATIATVLGTLAALALVRAGRFRGRTLFAGLVFAPLVMPEVITGLALLLLFVAVDFDRSLEEAALDLGATPLRAFLSVTLPVIFPAVAAGWLLAFTLSLDDLVIANFTAGPGNTTLPMRIYSQVRLGVTPEVNAISTVFIVAITAVVLTASLAMKWQQGRSERA
jgi:putrescine transport system permease protein